MKSMRASPTSEPTGERRAATAGRAHPADGMRLPSERVGNRAVLGALRSGALRGGALRRKRDDGARGDPSERAADGFADRVSPGAAPPAAAGRVSALSAAAAVPSPGPGRPLDSDTRRDFEARLGTPLGSVRVHDGSEAAASARAVAARAYALGHDVVFGAGQYAPHTPRGRWLLAHELSHVAEQQTTGPRLARNPDPAPADTAQDEATEVENAWHDFLTELTADVEAITAGTGKYEDLDQAEVIPLRARVTRRIAIVAAFKPVTWDELATLQTSSDAAAETEDKALEAIKAFGARGDKVDPLLETYGFPTKWAERLEKTMRPVLDVAEMGRRRQAAWDEVQKAGAAVPDYIVAHGLPVDFDTAMDLDRFTVSAAVRRVGDGSALGAYQAAAATYGQAYADEQLATRYAGAIRSLIADVRAGEKRVNLAVWDQYAHDRSWAPTPGDLFRWQQPSGAFVEPDEVNPYDFERTTYEVLLALRFLDLMSVATTTRADFDKWLAVADTRIAALDGFSKLALAHAWSSEHGYGAYVRSILWEQLKDALTWDTAKDMAKETAKFLVIQEIPVVNVLYDLFLVAKAVVGFGEALWDLAEAEGAARAAKTVASLQKASARLTLAEHSDVLKMAGDLLEAYGSWTAMRSAMRAHVPDPAAHVHDPKAPKVGPAPTRVEPTPTRVEPPAPHVEPPAPHLAPPTQPPVPVLDGISAETQTLLAQRPGLAKVLTEHPRAADFFKLCESTCFPDFLTDDQMLARLLRLEQMEAEAARHGIRFERAPIKKLLHGQKTLADVDASLADIEAGLTQRIRSSWQPTPGGEPPHALGGAATRMPARAPKPTGEPQQFQGLGADKPPAGHEDLFDTSGMETAKTPGGVAEKAKTFAGKFVDRKIEILQTNPDVLADMARRGIDGQAIFSHELPLGMVAEHPIPHTGLPDPPRIDRLWREGDTIFELKPNTRAAVKGEAQAAQYAEWMNRVEPLPPPRRWVPVVVTYDQKLLMKYLQKIGMLP